MLAKKNPGRYDLPHILRKFFGLLCTQFTRPSVTMFKKTAAFLLLLCCMAQTFSRAAMVGGYYLNKAVYLRNCENKAKPQLHCNGHCQLLKKMKQEEKKEAQNPERRSSGKEEVLSSKSYFASVCLLPPVRKLCFTDHPAPSVVGRPSTVFHPPGV